MAAPVPPEFQKFLTQHKLPAPDWYVGSAEGGWTTPAQDAWNVAPKRADASPVTPASHDH